MKLRVKGWVEGWQARARAGTGPSQVTPLSEHSSKKTLGFESGLDLKYFEKTRLEPDLSLIGSVQINA